MLTYTTFCMILTNVTNVTNVLHCFFLLVFFPLLIYLMFFSLIQEGSVLLGISERFHILTISNTV